MLEDNKDIKRELSEELDTDKARAIKVLPISFDMCARVNSLINPKWSNVKLFLRTRHIDYLARVVTIVPSTRPGYLIVECDTVMKGRVLQEVGGGTSFDLRFQ